MPELPDLEVFASNIPKMLTSKRPVAIAVYSPKITTPQSILAAELAGQTLQHVTRYGKELFFDFGEGKVLSVHLMLNGRISVTNHMEVNNIRSKVLAIQFENETLTFHDYGNIGTVIKYKPPASRVPDAIGENFTLEYFLGTAHKKASANIKAFLIDQQVVKGIGNAYADEILYAAKVSPKSITGRIPTDVLAQLYAAIGTVLHSAIASIREIAPDIIAGEERSFLQVHTRTKKQTATGFAIKVETVAGKTTYFTDEQVLY